MKSTIVVAVLSAIFLSACNQIVAEPAAQASRPDTPSLQSAQEARQSPVLLEEDEAPLTRQQKIVNIENYFGGLRANFTMALGLHDAVLGRIKMDVQEGDMTAARKHARMLIDTLQEQQSSTVTADILYDHDDIPQELLDDLEATSNALFGDLVGSAAGIAAVVDFGMGENDSDFKSAEKNFKKLHKLMLRVYKIYGYTPAQVDEVTWRLKHK